MGTVRHGLAPSRARGPETEPVALPDRSAVETANPHNTLTTYAFLEAVSGAGAGVGSGARSTIVASREWIPKSTAFLDG